MNKGSLEMNRGKYCTVCFQSVSIGDPERVVNADGSERHSGCCGLGVRIHPSVQKAMARRHASASVKKKSALNGAVKH
jgi:hypothetical protein